MKQKRIIGITACVLVILSAYHSFFLTTLYSLDEIWIYGFGYNITQGLIPYKDFNMIIPPLFPYIVALTIKIFGNKLLVYHVLTSILIVAITYLSWKKIKWYAILIYLCLLLYPNNGYNIMSLFLFFLLLNILHNDSKNQDLKLAFIISLMFLTKQTLAILIIPSIIYARNKKKISLVYLVSILSVFLFLLCNNNLLEFINYCFLGMLNFADKNQIQVAPFFQIEIVFCLFLLANIIKTKGKRKELVYIFIYQIIVFPIVDISHFILGWSTCLYLIFQPKKMSFFHQMYLFIVLLTIQLCVLAIRDYQFTWRISNYLEHYSEQTFLEGKLVPSVTSGYLKTMKEIQEQYPDYRLYILGNYAYLVKLSLNIPIDKYDLINAGNMGYHGAELYQKEIDKYCQENKCIFIVNDSELTQEGYNQTELSLLIYVKEQYTKIYSSNIFGVYIN